MNTLTRIPRPTAPSNRRPNQSVRMVSALLLAAMLLTALGAPLSAVQAQGGGGSITHTTAGDFAAVCAVPSGVSVSDAGGGELRLAATVEDYFNGASIDSGRWLTANVYTWYTVPPTVSSGVLTLDASYLRSQTNLQPYPVRFFEARALQRAGAGFAGWPDLGFYRALPPLDGNAVTADTAMRLFISRDNNTTYTRGRDGDGSATLYDTDIPTLNLQQYHLFRIEWDGAQTRFYVDGVQQSSNPGVSTLNTYAFLYHQTPTTNGSSPMQVDWVRAGAYAPTGTYTSCALDAGATVTWQNFAQNADLPAGTAAGLQTRTSDDGVNWSDWAAANGSAIASPNGRFLQYQLALSTNSALVSPEVTDLTFNFAPPGSVTDTPTPTFTATNPPPPTATNTPLPTNTPTLPPPATNTPLPTNTPAVPPTATNTPLPTNTFTPAPTSTNTPLPTSTATATATSVAPPVTDDFNRADSTNLGPNWTERVGNMAIFSNTLRNGSPGGDIVATYTGTYTNVQASAVVQFASNVGTISIGTRLGFSGSNPVSGYAVELYSSGQVYLWRVDNWALLGSYTIPGYISNQPTTLSLSASGSTIRVDINGVARITANNTAFTSGMVGLWSYNTSATNQHVFDNFILVNLTQPSPTPTATFTPTATLPGPPPPTAIPTSTATSVPPPQPNIVHTTAGDFGPVCVVLNNTIVSNANGGEIRLAAPVEDYFSGTSVDTSQWLTGTVYTWYTVPPTVSGGLLTLDSAYLRSLQNMQPYPVRFFEARALQRSTADNAAWPDLGFFRALPPLDANSITADSALRLFVTRDNNTTYTRGRDGDLSAPLIDVDIPNITLQNYHLFRIEWDTTQTRFYVDGDLQSTINGVSTLNTWAFLYNQTPFSMGGSRMQVDWVRAGAYPSSGVFTSCALDAGGNANWQTTTLLADIPNGTGVNTQTRTSNDGFNWSAWSAVVGNVVTSPAGRYLQYRLNLSGTALLSPEVRQVSLAFAPISGPTNTPTLPPPATSTNTPGPTPTNTPLPTATNTPLPTNTPTQPPPPTSTNTPGPTATNTPLPTATNTPLPSNTPTATLPPTSTNTPSPVTDNFNRADSTNLGANWTENAGNWQIFSNTLRNASTGGDAVATYTGAYTNVQVSSDVWFASAAGTITIGARLGAFSGGVPTTGYAAEITSAGLVVLWRVDTWAILGSYQIPSYASATPTALTLDANGSTIRVLVNGVQRISAANTAFASGSVGVWSYNATAANQHIWDNFNLIN